METEWKALQALCPDATPYQTWEWNEAWWRHFGSHKRLRLLLFYSSFDDSLVGIAPCYASRHLGTPVRRLAWIGTGQSDYLGPLALPNHAVEVASQMLTYLQTGLGGWDIADLQHLRPGSALLTAAERQHAEHPRGDIDLLPIETCPYAPLDCSWEEFGRRLGKKLRSNLAYYERLILRTFPDAAFSLADQEQLQEGMTALFRLHQSRWNARWLPGVLGGKRIQAFHREVAARFLENGWLRLHLLHADGAIRAALYCFAHGGKTLYYLGGFAPEYAKFSLGTVLTARAIQTATEEHCTEFDFLRGEEPYKYRWAPEERINYRLLQLRVRRGGLGNLPGRAGFALNRVERFLVHRAKRLVEKQQEKPDKGAQGRKRQKPRISVRATSQTEKRS